MRYVNLYATGTSDGTSWVNAYTDLQVALAAAVSGDSIFVATGTYQPASGTSFYMHFDLKIFGGFTGNETRVNQRNLANKATLQGNGASVIHVIKASAAGLWDGFIVTGGNSSVGGGINNDRTFVTIRNCIISGNTATAGGGMHNLNSSSPTVMNCLFSGNTGSGVYNEYNSSATLVNCTLSDNTANSYGGAISIHDYSSCQAINCVIWGNTAPNLGNGIYYDNTSSATVTYSNIQDAITGTGNISVDPMFVTAGSETIPTTSGDYRLRTGSPAIDAGNNAANTLATDLAGNPRIRSGVIEMGAYENTPQSKIVYVDSSISVSGDGSSWAKAYKTLSDALQGASVDFTTVDSIFVAKGTYYPTGTQNSTQRDSSFLILRSGIKVFGGYASGGSPTRDPLANPTILSGNIGDIADLYDNSVHVLVLAGIYKSADSVVLDGLSFNDGSTSSIAGSTKTYNGVEVLRTAGGGVNTTNNLNDNIAFRNCHFSNNILHVSIGGGGMYNESSSPFIGNCTFSNNTGNGSGGGIFNQSASPVVDHCTFIDNAIQSNGGGMYNYAGSNPLVTNSIFKNNTNAGTGGAGMFNNNSTPTIINCTFLLNQGSNVTTNNTGGGGMYNLNCSPVITGCTFASNYAPGLGGGGMLNNNAAPMVTDCVFLGNRTTNSVGSGGGMCNFAGSAPIVTNCLFSGNTVDLNGGGLSINTSTATLINCTFSGNYCNEYGGAIYSYNATSDPVIQNTIIWGNLAVRGNSGMLSEGGTVSISFSDIQSISGGTDGNISIDPLFVNAPAAQSYPVTGGDFNLKTGSPAINAGHNSFNLEATDLAGNPRVFGSAIDIGAYESQQATVPVTLIGFSGVLQGGIARLGWETGLESALDQFEIEKSVNGASFATIAVITPKGSNNSYAYAQPQSEPKAYYRLKFVESNGRFGYSDIITLKQNAVQKLAVYPNPARDFIDVYSANTGDVRIYNAAGVLVKTETVQAGSNRIDIRLLSAGVYFVRISGAAVKLIKQ